MTATERYFLSLDTSLTKSGWAILAVDTSQRVRVVDYGLIKSTPKLTDGERLREIHRGIMDVLERYPSVELDIPREAGIVRFNLPTKQIFKAHGVTEFSLADYTIHDVNITTVKAWARRVTGSGGKRNDKDMIAEALRIYFDAPEMKFNKGGDEADAIAVGIVYLTQTKQIKAVA